MTDNASAAVAGGEAVGNVPALLARPTWADGLTGKQRAFVEHWLSNGFSGRRAAIAAGYAPGSADVEASRQLANAKVASAIEMALGELGIARVWVLRELAAIARGVATDVAEWSEAGVKVKPSSELTRDEAALVESVEQEATEFGPRVRIKLRDKLAALNALARALGLHRADGIAINSGGAPVQVVIKGDDAAVL